MNKEVFFGCDNDGDHKAPISECINTEKLEFSSIEEAESFIIECTIVHNLDEVIDPVPVELMPDLDQEIINI